MSKGLRTVSNFEQVIANIEGFGEEVASNRDLQSRLPYVRSFYFIRNKAGRWIAAGSKYAGYRDASARTYLSYSDKMDGRKTERILGEWFVAVPYGDPLFDELREWLYHFFDQFDKKPSAVARLNVLKPVWDEQVRSGSIDQNLAIADLIVAVARRLPEELRQQIKRRF